MKKIMGLIVCGLVLANSGCTTFWNHTVPVQPMDQKKAMCLAECKKHAEEWCKTHPGQCNFKLEDWCIKNGNC